MTVPSHILAAAGNAQAGPLYVYDLAVLRARLERLQRLPIPHKRIHFATMANDHPMVLAEIAAAGHGCFVNSARHLSAALSAGFAPDRIIFAASNMTTAQMRHCHATGVHVVLDSLSQVRAFDSIASPGTSIGIRVNVGSAVEAPEIADEPSYRFGLMPDELEQALRETNRVSIRGVHSYFGTDIMSPNVLVEGLRRLACAAAALPDLTYIDAGGGFGIADEPGAAEFDLESYGRAAAAELRNAEQRLGRRLELVIEPGRWTTAPIGWFFARVVDVKHRADRIFAGTSASVAQFPRPLMYPGKAVHPCEIVGHEANRRMAEKPVWVSGNSTYSRDFLARGVSLVEPKAGDLIAFHHAGAYCRSMLTDFLGMERPDEVMLNRSLDQPVLLNAAE